MTGYIKWAVLLGTMFLTLNQMTLCASEDAQGIIPGKEKQNNVAICAIFKNEATYLKEWVEYHKLIGVDHFYLYNNSSEDQFEKILSSYIAEGLITLINWPDRTLLSDTDEAAAHWALSTQLLAYEHAIQWVSAKKTKWLIFLDVDEFLVPVQSHSLTQFLEKYNEYPAIQITSEYFEASHFAHALPKRDLLISTVELTEPPVQRIQTSVEKMFIKPDRHSYFTWPPYQCHIKNESLTKKVNAKELRINKYVNRVKPIWKFERLKRKLHFDHRLLADYEKKELLGLDYEIDDREKAIFKFIPELTKNMGLEQGYENH